MRHSFLFGRKGNGPAYAVSGEDRDRLPQETERQRRKGNLRLRIQYSRAGQTANKNGRFSANLVSTPLDRRILVMIQ